ncbi:MAG TPA: ABC transporter permease [Roseiflexaceae bacterium]|nr:ABC transporter permease [Roseiflexaceae bacterium]
MGPRWSKILGDLRGSLTRTILVVLSIAVGVFAIGVSVSTRVMLERELSASYAAVRPSSATLYPEPFDDDLVAAVRGMREVADAEGRRTVTMQVQVAPDSWKRLTLYAIADFDDIRVNQIRRVSGDWPPPERELLIERAALPMLGVQEGQQVAVRTPDDTLRHMRLAGVAHDLMQFPAPLADTIYGYVTFDTLEWLGEERSYNELYVVARGDTSDIKHVQQVANTVRDKVEKSGRTVQFVWVPEPGKHPAASFFETLLLLLSALGFLSLALSGFLVVNTISALLAQQVRQIGVMKAIGARGGQIMRMYFATVLIFGLIGLAVAVPLGALGAVLLTGFLANLINFDLTSTAIPPEVLALQVIVGLLVPALAAIVPVLGGIRVTVREAISSYGLGKGQFGTGRLDRLLERVRGLSRPLVLSLRNTFRRKGRLALTMTTLTLAGAIFVSVFSVRESMLLTLDDVLRYYQYDVQITFNRPYRTDQVARIALQTPGVVGTESWGAGSARRVRPDGSEGDAITITAPPADSRLIQPMVLQGRWLLPEDESAVVISSPVLKKEPDLKLGDELTLKIDGQERRFRLVGVVQFIAENIYVNEPYFSRITTNVGRTTFLLTVTREHSAEAQQAAKAALDQAYKRAGVRAGTLDTVADLRKNIEFFFSIIVVPLLLMAVLLGFVGGLGLMGTMSINVLERTREIGVMRAIGATGGAVRQIVLVEGVLIGGLSGLLGALIALPMGRLLGELVGVAFWQSPLSYTFSVAGVAIWLTVVMGLAALASVLPAWRAARLTVREVLAYE